MAVKFSDDVDVYQMRNNLTNLDQLNGITAKHVVGDYGPIGSSPNVNKALTYLRSKLPENPLRLTLHLTNLPPDYKTISSDRKQFWEWMLGLHSYQRNNDLIYSWIGRLPYQGTPSFYSISNLPIKKLIEDVGSAIPPIVNQTPIINLLKETISPFDLFTLYPKYIQFLQLSDREPISTILTDIFNSTTESFDTWFDDNKSTILSLIPIDPNQTSLREQISDNNYKAVEDKFPNFYDATNWSIPYTIDRPKLHVSKNDVVTPVYKVQDNFLSSDMSFFGYTLYDQDQVNYEYLSRRHVRENVDYTEQPKAVVVQIPRPCYTQPKYLYYSTNPEHFAGIVYPHHN